MNKKLADDKFAITYYNYKKIMGKTVEPYELIERALSYYTHGQTDQLPYSKKHKLIKQLLDILE